MRKTSFHTAAGILCLVAVLHVCSGNAPAHPAGANNWHLNSPLQARLNANLVCKVHVTSVRDAGLVPCDFSLGAHKVMRRVATAQVVSVVAGECPGHIRIVFDFPPNDAFPWGLPIGRLFTEIRAGEACLLFLRGSGEDYRLHRIRSKARVIPSPVTYDLGDDPLLRLLAEFWAGLSADDQQVRLQAAEELGYIGDALMEQLGPFHDGDEPERSRRIAQGLRQGRDVIRQTRSDENFVVRATAVTSSFALGDPPSLDQAMEVMLADPNRFTAAESRAEYGIRDFSVPALQKRLLETMDATTRRALRGLDDGRRIRRIGSHPGPYRGVPGFPYAKFFRMALPLAPVRQDPEMRQAIANVIWIRYEQASLPEMIGLLDDDELAIRRTAVSALNKCVNGKFSNAWDRRTFYGLDRAAGKTGQIAEMPLEQRLADYERYERQYIAYWQEWWQRNREKFEHEDSSEAAMLPEG